MDVSTLSNSKTRILYGFPAFDLRKPNDILINRKRNNNS